jgi:hypothetical protein
MTITITPEELTLLMNKTRNWNAGLVDHVLSKATVDPLSHQLMGLDELKKQYIKNNPEPNWKDLL